MVRGPAAGGGPEQGRGGMGRREREDGGRRESGEGGEKRKKYDVWTSLDGS